MNLNFIFEFRNYLVLFCNPSSLKPTQTIDVTQASDSEREYEKLAVVVHVLQNTQNLVISRCCFAEYGKEMYKDL